MHLNTYGLDTHRDGAHNDKDTYNIAHILVTRSTSYPWNHPQILVHIDSLKDLSYLDRMDSFQIIVVCCK